MVNWPPPSKRGLSRKSEREAPTKTDMDELIRGRISRERRKKQKNYTS